MAEFNTLLRKIGQPFVSSLNQFYDYATLSIAQDLPQYNWAQINLEIKSMVFNSCTICTITSLALSALRLISYKITSAVILGFFALRIITEETIKMGSIDPKTGFCTPLLSTNALEIFNFSVLKNTMNILSELP